MATSTSNDDDVLPEINNRDDFDPDFVFGSATSCYQVEGAAAQGGKGASVWDSWTLNSPSTIGDGSNGNVTAQQYYMYKEDVRLMKKIGLDAYRFSISWPRLLPGGKLCSGINPEGIKYYNDLIDTIIAEGLTPYATIFHWDLPVALEVEYRGFLSDKIVGDFRDYAELCFFQFGDRVKHWITVNEAWTYTYMGYVKGTFPPGRGPVKAPNEVQETTKNLVASARNLNLSSANQLMNDVNLGINLGHRNSGIQAEKNGNGDPGTEPYIVAHNIILAHAAAVDLYRKEFQECQGGEIGMTNNINHYIAHDPDNPLDVEAAQRAIDFMLGWFVNPLVHGDYPERMRQRVGNRLPEFKESADSPPVKGSYDFLGINYYTTYYAISVIGYPRDPSYEYDKGYVQTPFRNNVPIGEKAGSDWLYIYPEGIYLTLDHIKTTYENPLVYITENGVDEKNDFKKTVCDARYDQMRIDYHHDHLQYVKLAITKGCNVKAYFIWAFSDNFEWTEGFTVRFGIFYIDFNNGLFTRYPKKSALWWSKFLNKKPINTLPVKSKVASLKNQAEKVEDKSNSLKRPRRNIG